MIEIRPSFPLSRLPPTNGGCFTLWYHMVGSGIGSLNIMMALSPTQNVTLWTLSGAQANQWSSAQVPVISPKNSFFVSNTSQIVALTLRRNNCFRQNTLVILRGYSLKLYGFFNQGEKFEQTSPQVHKRFIGLRYIYLLKLNNQ